MIVDLLKIFKVVLIIDVTFAVTYCMHNSPALPEPCSLSASSCHPSYKKTVCACGWMYRTLPLLLLCGKVL